MKNEEINKKAKKRPKQWDVNKSNEIKVNKNDKINEKQMDSKTKKMSGCPYEKKCGGCFYHGENYGGYLEKKQSYLQSLFADYVEKVNFVGMENPFNYRHKVNAAFQRKKDGSVHVGVYKEGTHDVVDIESCLIENQLADSIIRDIKGLLKSFKILIYDEDKGTGLLRHVMVRVGRKTGQVMVILVVVNPVFPSKNNFVKALRKLHPEISTVVLNVNEKDTSMVLGTRDIVLYGKGKILDQLCGITYELSPQSFFQVNPEMTEKIYETAINYAELKKRHRVFDAYCGIGTIGLTAANRVSEVIGVELNKEAVKDAISNARRNDIKNAHFYQNDAGKFMVEMAENGEKCDVLFMDPPRSGSTTEFINAIHTLLPDKVVYISCDPETLARDLKLLTKKNYKVLKITGFDQFPWTKHVETVCLLSHNISRKKNI